MTRRKSRQGSEKQKGKDIRPQETRGSEVEKKVGMRTPPSTGTYRWGARGTRKTTNSVEGCRKEKKAKRGTSWTAKQTESQGKRGFGTGKGGEDGPGAKGNRGRAADNTRKRRPHKSRVYEKENKSLKPGRRVRGSVTW